MPYILLQNATILVPSGKTDDYVVPLRHHSLLIKDDKIAQIAPKIISPAGAQVIDCTNKIISPGFIDTHHHLWQTQLKGRHANQSLLEYIPSGNAQAVNYSPQDVFWGVLGGCLEALEAGTTTVVDHANINVSPAHSSNNLEATVASGLRSVFCFGPIMRVKTWKPEVTSEGGLLDEWVIETFEKLGASAPFGNGRVQLGLAFDGFMLPKEKVVSLYEQARRLGTKVITSHYAQSYFGNSPLVNKLEDYGLLGPDVLLSHATNLSAADIERLNKARASISSTPDTELQMGHGDIVCFREGCFGISSLGIDCHSNNSGDMVSQMRLALQHERSSRNSKIIAEGKSTLSLNLFVQDAFALGTIKGARAIQMEDKLGSIKVGKLADLVIFNGNSPGMICATEEDPVAAIILHSSVRDIDTVIVDGEIRKQDGNLLPTTINPSLPDVTIPQQTVGWSQVARKLVSSRENIENARKESNADDSELLTRKFMKLMHLDEAKFVKMS